ncbi:MAG: hypothetical protein CVV64_01580 [Candidatus Wallbacteria bacterium HGW-Wallbacteria-1]|jgi:general secretion pathway protein G|uniref:Type II secretion system protein GspG C-terminal domain-containing protein n=1 Tax=Candidatus Wallbacteria bacterium HGW-Wallbacteria-1 TaxID=2013854 RepID=A0A2N1PUZ6_9BACT|nr:MAG: hypothetical protein CVV64_01580 [Candidatus Wallbacteria bacterium HGW-Wallbacteria-1]
MQPLFFSEVLMKPTDHKHNEPQAGFTLLELMIVVSLIALLATIMVPRAPRLIARARDARVMEELSSIRVSVTSYYGANGGKFPEDLNELEPDYIKALPKSWKGSKASGTFDYDPDRGTISLKADAASGSSVLDSRGVSYGEY